MKGCMNCGNISCGNNKKRDCAGCGRWISPEDKIAELQKIVESYDRNRDRLIAMGFPHFRNCKEYAEKLKELEKENTELKKKYVKNITDCDICDTYCNSQLIKAKELLERFLGLGNLWDLDCKDYFPLRKEAEQFLNSEVEKCQKSSMKSASLLFVYAEL